MASPDGSARYLPSLRSAPAGKVPQTLDTTASQAKSAAHHRSCRDVHRRHHRPALPGLRRAVSRGMRQVPQRRSGIRVAFYWPCGPAYGPAEGTPVDGYSSYCNRGPVVDATQQHPKRNMPVDSPSHPSPIRPAGLLRCRPTSLLPQIAANTVAAAPPTCCTCPAFVRPPWASRSPYPPLRCQASPQEAGDPHTPLLLLDLPVLSWGPS